MKTQENCKNDHPTWTGKCDATPLLFQAAVTYAAEGCHVIYITESPLTRLPPPIHAMPSPTASVLNNVQFMYLQNVHDLLTYTSTCHQSPHPTDVIIVHDLHTYLPHTQDPCLEQTAAKTIALLIDSLNSPTSQRQTGLILSMSPHLRPILSAVLTHFNIPLADLKESSEPNTYTLLIQENEDSWKCEYTIKADSILLSQVTHSCNIKLNIG